MLYQISSRIYGTSPIIDCFNWMGVAELLGNRFRQRMEWDGHWSEWRTVAPQIKGRQAPVASIAKTYECCIVTHRVTGKEIAWVFRAQHRSAFPLKPTFQVAKPAVITITKRITPRKNKKTYAAPRHEKTNKQKPNVRSGTTRKAGKKSGTPLRRQKTRKRNH